jgi:hypothetical protein
MDWAVARPMSVEVDLGREKVMKQRPKSGDIPAAVHQGFLSKSVCRKIWAGKGGGWPTEPTGTIPVIGVDYHFELLSKEERGAHSTTRCATAHHDDIRAAPRANRTQCTAGNPVPDAASSTDKRPAAAPSRPWRSSVPGASVRHNRFLHRRPSFSATDCN